MLRDFSTILPKTVVTTLTTIAFTVGLATAEDARFVYKEAKPVAQQHGVRRHEQKVPRVDGIVYVHTSFHPGEHNPVERVDDSPQAVQWIELGSQRDGEFVSTLRFGLNDSGAGPGKNHALLTPWFHDGRLDYYGAFARPQTPQDFKIIIDRSRTV